MPTPNPTCGHAICALIGGACSLATGMSRGCRTGWNPERELAPEVVDEVRALLAELDPFPADPADPAARARQQTAATRLAFVFRREARDERNLLVLAADGELEPELRARLEALCRRPPRA